MKMKSIISLAILLGAITTAFAEDFKGKISKVMSRPSTTTGKTVVTIYFQYPLEYRRPEAIFNCIENADHSVQISDANTNMPLSTVNQILSLALTAYSTGSSFALDVDGNASGGACGNGVFGFILR